MTAADVDLVRAGFDPTREQYLALAKWAEEAEAALEAVVDRLERAMVADPGPTAMRHIRVARYVAATTLGTPA